MTAGGETYRRLPGRRRGIVGGASIWMGSDHLLLVKSAWYREEYRRFYLRDIQAIVVAPCPRFHVSLPMLLFALAWLLPGVSIAFWPAGLTVIWAVGGTALLATWIAISVASSCRCRIHTAVSKEDLPSLYRTWTARKFLDRVRPWIEQAQGGIEPGWPQAATSAAPVETAAPQTEPVTQSAPPIPQPAAHSLAADLFVLLFLGGAVADLLSVHWITSAWQTVRIGISVAQLAGAVAVLIQHYRSGVGRPMKRLAVAALVVIGILFYVQSVSLTMTNSGRTYAVAAFLGSPIYVLMYQIGDGLKILIGLIGAAMILRDSFRRQPDIIKD